MGVFIWNHFGEQVKGSLFLFIRPTFFVMGTDSKQYSNYVILKLILSSIPDHLYWLLGKRPSLQPLTPVIYTFIYKFFNVGECTVCVSTALLIAHQKPARTYCKSSTCTLSTIEAHFMEFMHKTVTKNPAEIYLFLLFKIPASLNCENYYSMSPCSLKVF